MSLSRDQLLERRGLITSTDAKAIVGVDPFRSRVEVWLSKQETGEPEDAKTYAQQRGHALEQLGLDELAARAGLTVMANKATLRAKDRPWLAATPDGLVLEWDGAPASAIVAAAEAKSVGLHMVRDWSDEEREPIVPLYVQVQCVVQMHVLDVPRAFVSAMLDTEGEPRIYTLERDLELEGVVVEECERFWIDHVVAGVPPEPSTAWEAQQVVKRLFPRPTIRDMVQATDDVTAMAVAYALARDEEKLAKERKEALQAELCGLIGEHEGIVGPGWRAFWKEREEYQVEAYTVPAGRRFDLRQVTRSFVPGKTFEELLGASSLGHMKGLGQ